MAQGLLVILFLPINSSRELRLTDGGIDDICNLENGNCARFDAVKVWRVLAFALFGETSFLPLQRSVSALMYCVVGARAAA